MENQLHARDLVGVQDFVLLEEFRSSEAFIENLRKRYEADLIYVSASTGICRNCRKLNITNLVLIY